MFDKDNLKEQAKQEIREEGFPIYMDSIYCKDMAKKNISCEKCEYTFACNKVLERTLQKSVNYIREAILENEAPVNSQKIHSEECKQHLLTAKCDSCENDKQCYLDVLRFFRENINFGKI